MKIDVDIVDREFFLSLKWITFFLMEMKIVSIVKKGYGLTVLESSLKIPLKKRTINSWQMFFFSYNVLILFIDFITSLSLKMEPFCISYISYFKISEIQCPICSYRKINFCGH